MYGLYTVLVVLAKLALDFTVSILLFSCLSCVEYGEHCSFHIDTEHLCKTVETCGFHLGKAYGEKKITGIFTIL